jgi:drug/metabolite transporter (DMT)-like permease
MKKSDRYLTPLFLMIPFTWAGSFIAGKYVIREIDPIGSVVLRFLLSALVMLPGLVLLHRRHHPKFTEAKFLLHLAIVVLTAGIGYHILFFWALRFTSPTNTSLIIALNPFFTALAEVVIFRVRRPGRFYIGFALAFGGAVWVNLSRGGAPNLSNLGIGELLCLAASLLWSAYTLLARATKQPEWDSLWINAYNYLFTAVLLMPFSLNLFDWNHLQSIHLQAWMGSIYMAIFPTVIGYTLFYIGVQKRGAAWAATFVYLVPSITANLDYLFFGAALTTAMVAGTTVVVAGLIIGNLGANQINWLRDKLRSSGVSR